MNYSQAKEFLYSRVANFSRKNQNYHLHLHLVRFWLAELGNPQLSTKAIHIAGTNGKGSVTTMLSQVLHAQGYKVGRYMSPHAYDMRERICYNGDFIAQDFVADFVNSNRDFILKYAPSFFEIMTVMAWCYFREQGVQIACVETGLGGRLDATNILNPVLCIITNISLDHTEYLGRDIASIAKEKLGIIKVGVPLLIGKKDDLWADLARAEAIKSGAEIHFAEEKYRLERVQKNSDSQELLFRDIAKNHLQSYKLRLLGNYQQDNVRTVLSALALLSQDFPVAESKLKQALAEVCLPARWQILTHSPLIIADAGHNEGAMQFLGAQLQEKHIARGKLYILLALTKEKDPCAVFAHLPAEAEYYTCTCDTPRAMPAQELGAALQKMGRSVQIIPDPNLAWAKIRTQLRAEDTLLITGSFMLMQYAKV